MPVFEYTARDEAGQLVSERMAFHDEAALKAHLRRNSLFVLTVSEQRRKLLRLGSKVGLGDLVVMARQLRTMVLAGMPLVVSLEALADQSTNAKLTEVLAEVARAVGTGRSLAATLADYPGVFPELLVTLIGAGEEAGRLPEALQEASRQLQLQLEVRQKLISAMMYPGFTVLAMCGTVAAMLIFIVPVFAGIYGDLHAKLPAPTLLLMAISNILVHYSWVVALVFAAALYLLRRFYRTPDGRMKIDGLILKIPMFGNLFLKSASANLTGTLAGLLDSGVPLLKALDTASRVTGNAVLAHAIVGVAANVTAGKRLSDEMELTGQFPVMVVRMIGVAEDVGTLPEVLRHISGAYIEEVQYAIGRIMTLIEPMMTLLVAAVIGFVLVALYYPIFNIGNVFLEGA